MLSLCFCFQRLVSKFEHTHTAAQGIYNQGDVVVAVAAAVVAVVVAVAVAVVAVVVAVVAVVV